MPDLAFPFSLPFLAAKDAGKGNAGPGVGRGRGTGVDKDEHPEFNNGACLNHPEGCGLPEAGSRPGSGGGGGPYIGGDPSQGRYAMASDPGAPAEPPMSPSGHSYWTDEELEANGGSPWGRGQ